MPVKELKAQYGKNKKPKAAINTAIRNEIPGGGKILDLTYKISLLLPKLPPKNREVVNDILNDLNLAAEEMKNHIAAKYRLATAEKQPEQLPEEKRKPGRPSVPPEQRRDQQITIRLTAEEIYRITEPGHRKRLSEDIRQWLLSKRQKENSKKLNR
jgi:uncharacterized protein (DUF4415 family)